MTSSESYTGQSEAEEPEQNPARRRYFADMADRFTGRIRSAPPGANVTLLYYLTTTGGADAGIFKVPLTPEVVMAFPGREGETASAAAHVAHLESAAGRIDALVRNAPTGAVLLPGVPGGPLLIRGFELEIGPPSSYRQSPLPPDVRSARDVRDAIAFRSADGLPRNEAR
jgi:hypothetical protein